MSDHYKSSLEHLLEELQRIDLMVRLQVLQFRKANHGEVDQLRGLYISEEEINQLLKASSSSNPATVSGTECERSSEHESLVMLIQQLQTRIRDRVNASVEKKISLQLYRLAALFQLSAFEIDALLICLAPELNLKYEKLYAYLQDDVTKKRPTVDLVLNLLSGSSQEKLFARQLFSPSARLMKYGLLQFLDDPQEKQKPLLARSLKVDERVVNFLLGIQQLDARIEPFARWVEPSANTPEVLLPQALKDQLSQLTHKQFLEGIAHRLIYYFRGSYGSGRKSMAKALCKELGLPLLIVDIKEILQSELHLEQTVRLILREGLLQPATVYVENFDSLLGEDEKIVHYKNLFLRALRELSGLTFLSGEAPFAGSPTDPSIIHIEFPAYDYSLRKQMWHASLNGHATSEELDIETIANKFRLTGGQIRDVVGTAKSLAMQRDPANAHTITMDDLYKACRVQSSQKLNALARKILPKYTWNDIILPRDKQEQLKEICRYVKLRYIVFSEWGFEQKLSLMKGLNILFAGASGTGKTMAAEIIAHELGLELYKIDLSLLVSKYIGETEKNLKKIFDAAESSNAILFFDEADALFGKRSEVKDSHDRYANIEINYLLQKMEEHEGIVILATNLRQNLDEAFSRRMHFSVEFPFPDEEHRERIWRSLFPKEAPVGEEVDFTFLAKRFKLAGGNIKNIIVHGAFLAAEGGGPIKMEHFIRGAKREYQKLGKLCVQTDFEPYYDLVKE